MDQLELEQLQAGQSRRLTILIIGGLLGLSLTILGLVLGWKYWSDLLTWLEPGGKQENGSGVLAVIGLILGGAAISFLALRVARTDERQSAVLRRILYGYNALLTGMLVFLNLLVFNCLVSARTSRPLDFTASGMYTLSPTSENILRNLKSPVTIYMILVPYPQPQYGNIDLVSSTEQLLTNASQFTDMISAERIHLLNPTERRSVQTLIEMRERYPGIIEVAGNRVGVREGILIVYNEGQSNEDHRFIPDADLFTADRGRGGESLYRGEDALMTELTFLNDEQKKTVVYFTQGRGELDLTSMDASGEQQGMGEFKRRMEKRNFEFKPLTLQPGEAVPTDASVVVVAGPKETLPEHAVKALQDYLGRQGKLVALLDLVVDRNGQVVPSGLEMLLIERSIGVKNERILSFATQVPTFVLAGMKTGTSNELAVALQRGRFLMDNARAVEALAARHPGAPLAEPLMDTRGAVLVDNQLNLTPIRLLNSLGRAGVEKRITDKPVVVAAVSLDARFESHSPDPSSLKPRLIVFGSSSLIGNSFISEAAVNNFDLMSSTFDWLRERDASIGIQPKTHEVFTVDPKIGMGRLFWLPAAIMLLGIAGVGTGVWLVRRQ